MFRFKSKRSKKQYELRTGSHAISMPLTFHGKSVELNSQVLSKGKYILSAEESKNQTSQLPVVAL